MKITITYILIIQGFSMVYGTALTLTTLNTYAHPDVPFYFFCLYQTRLTVIQEVVAFVRGNDIVVTLFQKEEACGISKITASRYHAHCGNRTEDPVANFKTFQYILEIKYPVDEDIDDWTCQTIVEITRSRYFRLRFSDITLLLNGSAPFTVWEKEFTLICTAIHYYFVDSVCFYRMDEHTGRGWCLNQTYLHCVHAGDMDPDYEPKCGNYTDNIWAEEKMYTLKIKQASKIDQKPWMCQLTLNGARSKHYKLIFPPVLTLSGSSAHAVMFKSFNFTCLAKHSVEMNDVIEFWTNSSVMGSLYQKYSQCGVSIAPTSGNYEIHCDKGTDNSQADMKMYILVIRKPTLQDQNVWWCQLKIAGPQSNKIFLTYQGFVLTLTGSSMQNTAELQKLFTFTCTITYAAFLNDVIQFFRESTLIAFLKQSHSQCSVSQSNHSENYQVTCAEGTDKTSSNTKVYQLKIHQVSAADGADWNCRMRKDKTSSNTITLKVDGFLLTLYGASESEYIVLGNKLDLSCRVDNAMDIDDRVQFVRLSYPLATLIQIHSQCFSNDPVSLYYLATCGEGTNTKMSLTKTYKLAIKQLLERDGTSWRCQLYKNGTRSNTLTLSFQEIKKARFGMEAGIGLGGAVVFIGVISIIAGLLYRRYKKKKQKADIPTEVSSLYTYQTDYTPSYYERSEDEDEDFKTVWDPDDFKDANESVSDRYNR